VKTLKIIQIIIKQQIKMTNKNDNQNSDDFNIINETLKLMSSNSSNSKKLTNIDLMVTKKSNYNNKKILPQKWE